MPDSVTVVAAMVNVPTCRSDVNQQPYVIDTKVEGTSNYVECSGDWYDYGGMGNPGILLTRSASTVIANCWLSAFTDGTSQTAVASEVKMILSDRRRS